MKKDRGKFLTIVIILSMLLSLIGLYDQLIHYPHAWDKTYIKVPEWFPLISLANIILSLILYIAIWKWKKWAVYILFFTFIITGILNIFVLQIRGIELVLGGYYGAVFIIIVSPLIWLWPIYRKWQYFK